MMKRRDVSALVQLSLSDADLWSRPWSVVRLLSNGGVSSRPHLSDGVEYHHQHPYNEIKAL